jgi:hypothetical protein
MNLRSPKNRIFYKSGKIMEKGDKEGTTIITYFVVVYKVNFNQ